MPVSQKVAESLADQLKDWNPDTPQIGAPQASVPSGAASGAQPGWTVGGSLSEGGKELASAAMKGFLTAADFMKNTVVGLAERATPEGSKYMNIAGVTMPRLPESGSVAQFLTTPWESAMLPEAKQRAEEPKTMIGKIGNPMAAGVGAMAAMPMGGGIVRNIVAGMGMGEFAELGKNVMGPIFGYFDPSLRKVGEAVGAIGGGMAGSQVNITKAQAITGGAQMALKYPGMAIEALKSARGKYNEAMGAWQTATEAGQQVPKPQLRQIFADEFASLRASTQGWIEQYTNQVLADLIRRDYQARGSVARFGQGAAQAEIDKRAFGLGEMTEVPAIVEMAAQRLPKTAAESSEMAKRAGLGIIPGTNIPGRQQAIVDAYNRLTDKAIPSNAQGIEAAAATLRTITQSKVNGLTAEMQAVKSQFPDLSPQMQYQLGEQLRAVRDARAQSSLDIAKGNYEQSFALAEGGKIPTGNTLGEAKDILKEFYTKIDPQETLSPVIANLVGALKKESKALPELILPADLAAERAAATEAQAKELSLRDANDLVRALGNAAYNARQAGQFQKYNHAKELQQTVLDAIDKSNISPEAKAAFNKARAYWADVHAPNFGEGLGKALGRERGGVLEGREAVLSEDVAAKMLSPTGVAEFDRIYGNDPTARTALQNTLEGMFRQKVLKGVADSDALATRLEDFTNTYGHVLERFPQTADKIQQRSAETAALLDAQKRELERYRTLGGGIVGRSVGVIQAKDMFERALADPAKMEQLLAALPKGKGDAALAMTKELFAQANPFRNGEYDAEALYKLLYAGKKNPQMASSMEKLFTAAFGPEGGREHFKTLEAIADFTKRAALTDPQNLRPRSLLSDQPLLERTGSSLASWASLVRSTASGFIGAHYAALVGVSRFANAKAQSAVEAAKMKALYDPETATAILRLAETPATEPLALTTAKKLWGSIKMPNGQNMVDYLVDRGYVKDYAVRGGIYGVEQSLGQREQRRQ